MHGCDGLLHGFQMHDVGVRCQNVMADEKGLTRMPRQ